MEFSRAKLYLVFVGIFLLIAAAIALYTFIANYISDKKADKRKVSFKRKNGKTKGYWSTKQGDKYDKDLKLED